MEDGMDLDEEMYQEREAVAIFDSEDALNSAVDALMQAGWSQDDLSLLGNTHRAGQLSKSAEVLGDRNDTDRAAFVSPDSRTEGLAALTAGPALLAGMGAAAIVTSGGTALLPILAVTAGSAAAAGGVGFWFAKAFGRKHAEWLQQQILNGGLLLWVHSPDPSKDETLLAALRDNGGRNVHVHVATRSWGVNEIPFHDAQPDPFLR